MKVIGAAVIALLATTTTTSSHHSFAAQYDSTKPLTVTGTVVKVDWSNPHIHFYVDVKNPDGTMARWTFEGYPPNMLIRQGWKRDETMKVGDVVSVSGWQARGEPQVGTARDVTWANGRKLTSGPPATIGGQ